MEEKSEKKEEDSNGVEQMLLDNALGKKKKMKGEDSNDVESVGENKNMIADGRAMSLKQMQSYLQESYGIPIVLREDGKTVIECPYCGHEHKHDVAPGYYKPECGGSGLGIVMHDRTFNSNYGYRILAYKNNGDTNTLIVPENELDK